MVFNIFTYIYNNVNVQIITIKNSKSIFYIFYPSYINCIIGSMIELSKNNSKYDIKKGLEMQSTIINRIRMEDIKYGNQFNIEINNSTYIYINDITFLLYFINANEYGHNILLLIFYE